MLRSTPETSSCEATGDLKRLILVSNRGPRDHFIDDLGRIRHRPSGGGVAVALSSIAEATPVTWIAGATSFADRAVALSRDRIHLNGCSTLRLLSLPEEACEVYYNSFCNPLLWFTQHSMGSSLANHDEESVINDWQTGYVPINRIFANAVIDELHAGGDGRVMLHDYHLYLAPRMIRSAFPHCLLQHFIHIPWPAPANWETLPDTLIRQICRGILANDSVVFQTESDLLNFRATCRSYLRDEVSAGPGSTQLTLEGRTVSLSANPISLDFSELRSLAEGTDVTKHRATLLDSAPRQTIVRVDRLDPSKNILKGFEAYDLLLRGNPGLHGKVRFLAFLVPSRLGIPEYDDYATRVLDLIDAINTNYGRPGWQPVTLYHEQNRMQALAGLIDYDVLLVNSVADGMNLVSKEGPTLNRRDGVLVLSRTAGSFEELRHGVLPVDPDDTVGTANALQTALSLPQFQRQELARRLRAAIQSHQLQDWLRHQLIDLEASQFATQTCSTSPR